MTVNVIESLTTKKMAVQIREFADEVERGNFIAVAFAIADKDSGGGHACFVDQNFATPELIDEMVHTLKVALFESYGDDQ